MLGLCIKFCMKRIVDNLLAPSCVLCFWTTITVTQPSDFQHLLLLLVVFVLNSLGMFKKEQ